VTPVAVVVPTIREDCARRFLAEWANDLRDALVIVVEDNPRRSFTLPPYAEHHAWDTIEADLGPAAWIIPRRSSAIRAYGLLKAHQAGAEVIWTLDDDCYPEDAWRGSYVAQVAGTLGTSVPSGAWWNTIAGTGLYPRGHPYGTRGDAEPVMVSHGLWSEIPDLDGRTQQAHPDFRLPPAEARVRVPAGALFAMCGMNLAFRREMAPAMYFMLMGEDMMGVPWGFHRFDDIWAGLMVKRICDHLGYAVMSGAPSVRHSRASDPAANAAKETAVLAAHEEFWPAVASVPLTADTVAGCYRELAAAVAGLGIPAPRRGYWDMLGAAMDVWAGLF
jgi:hypothetical protein